jgi:hypothetical protein
VRRFNGIHQMGGLGASAYLERKFGAKVLLVGESKAAIPIDGVTAGCELTDSQIEIEVESALADVSIPRQSICPRFRNVGTSPSNNQRGAEYGGSFSHIAGRSNHI